jgi:DNA-binding PucR family transcriptional regulator
VVLVDPHDEVARQVVDRLGTDCLPVRPGVDRGEHGARLWGAIVPEPDTLRGRTSLARQLEGAGAVVGYTVPLEKLPRSCEVARIAADLRRAGIVQGDPVFADEHLDTIIVWRDPTLVEALRGQVLAPLDDLAPGTRERLVETLRCWLRHQGNRHAMAEELRIHPQTVRYRLGQLQDLFGSDLEEPRSRARLFLALQWPTED